MTGLEYEEACAAYLQKRGFTNIELTPKTGDHGIDIIAHKNGFSYGVQCKFYTSGKVGNKAVQEAYAGCSYYHLDKPMVMTNNTFTQQAEEEAAELGVILNPNLKVASEIQALNEKTRVNRERVRQLERMNIASQDLNEKMIAENQALREKYGLGTPFESMSSSIEQEDEPDIIDFANQFFEAVKTFFLNHPIILVICILVLLFNWPFEIEKTKLTSLDGSDYVENGTILQNQGDDLDEYTFTDIGYNMTATGNVNVRSIPSIEGEIIGTLTKGSLVFVKRKCNETNWYEVEINGQRGYSSYKYFE